MPRKLNPSFASFNYFDALFKNTKQNTVLLMDANGIIKEINTAFTKRFGYAAKDIIGQHLRILFTANDQIKGLPEKEINTVLHYGQCMDNNYLVNKNKTITWVSGETILVKNNKEEISLLKVIQDINIQKLSENSLNYLNDFNENILQSIEDVVMVIDEELNIVKINKSISALFKKGATGTGMINFASIIKPTDVKNDLLDKMKNTLKNRVAFFNKEIEIETAAGKKVFDISCKPMENATTILLVAHDITMHRYFERQREDIIGFVAHELRNPLANIVLCNELLEETIKEMDANAAMDLLNRSKNNVGRLNKMIAELYDATKVGSGNMQLEISVFNFKEMIKEAVDTIEVLHPDYKIRVTGNADIVVHADKYRLIQAVTNFLSNGIKYSQGSSEVQLNVHKDNKNITVSVKDKGLGISKDQLPYIFNRFFRAEKTKNLEGVGLGLYLCRQIIQAHNGNIWAESEEGKGSTFYFSIPV